MWTGDTTTLYCLCIPPLTGVSFGTATSTQVYHSYKQANELEGTCIELTTCSQGMCATVRSHYVHTVMSLAACEAGALPEIHLGYSFWWIPTRTQLELNESPRDRRRSGWGGPVGCMQLCESRALVWHLYIRPWVYGPTNPDV